MNRRETIIHLVRRDARINRSHRTSEQLMWRLCKKSELRFLGIEATLLPDYSNENHTLLLVFGCVRCSRAIDKYLFAQHRKLIEREIYEAARGLIKANADYLQHERENHDGDL